MTKSNDDYPIFKVEEVVASRGPDYKNIVPHIDPRYFFSNPRFKTLGQISFPKLIDYMGIYEEGNRWNLTIIETTIKGATQYLFLPLTEGTPSDPRNPEYGKPAFGIETNSAFYGKRISQVFDAFADEGFISKLCNLILPRLEVPENHVNAYVDIQESGLGSFIFHTKNEITEPLDFYGEEVEPVKSNFVLNLGTHHLVIYQTLPVINTITLLEEIPGVTGWIYYTGEQDLQLLIGVLYKVANGSV
jgi:hypothetical protein